MRPLALQNFDPLPTTFPSLTSLKKTLKSSLKSYDVTFLAKEGRMPTKAEKEPIRHLYERYNSVKAEVRRR